MEKKLQLFAQAAYELIHRDLQEQGGGLPFNLRQVVDWYFASPGKGLRPALLLSCCEAAGGAWQPATAAAAAVEMYHTWTLLHDDVIDHDSLRRGRETGHVLGARLGREQWGLVATGGADDYGQCLAILAGDILQGRVVRLFSTLTGCRPVVALALLERLSGKLNQELLAGEQIDVDLSCRSWDAISAEEILEMMRLKTGALLAFCAETGVALGSDTPPADSPLALALGRFATQCGIAFQLQDDILGIIGNQRLLGKNVGSDLREGKRTWLMQVARQRVTASERAVLDQVLGNRSAGEAETAAAIAVVASCGAVEATAALAEEHVSAAMAILAQSVNAAAPRALLQAWAGLMTRRTK